jgi:hypothetical protein
MLGGQLPVDIKGTVKLPKIPTRELVGDFLDAKKITEELLCEHFLSMIKQVFTGIATKDHSQITKFTEATFAQKLIAES